MKRLSLLCLSAITLLNLTSCRSGRSELQSEIGPQVPAKLKTCGSHMTPAQYQELLTLSDISNFYDYHEAAPRTKRVAEIFAEAKDRHGIFASMYVAITQESTASSSRGAYEDSRLAGELVLGFARRYLGPLHDYLLDRPVIKEWQTYYDLARDCKASDLRILGSGVNTHLTFDLPHTVDEIKAPEGFEADFTKFGEILIQKKKESTDLLAAQQNVYASDFFDGFLLGKGIDRLFGAGSASYVGFRAIRAEAWHNGRMLQNPAFRGLAEGSIQSAWLARQNILRFVPGSKAP